MKSNTLFYTLLLGATLLPVELLAKDAKPQKSFTLIETINLKQKDDVIKANHPSLLKKDKTVKVVGRMRASTIKGKSKVLQVIWTGLQNEKQQHAAFEKPFITVVQVHNDELPKDINLPYKGDLKQLEIAYKKLKSGKVNLGKEVKAANPESDSRHVKAGDSVTNNGQLVETNGSNSLLDGKGNGSSSNALKGGYEGFDGKEGQNSSVLKEGSDGFDGKGGRSSSASKTGSSKGSTSSSNSAQSNGRRGGSHSQSRYGESIGARFQPTSAGSSPRDRSKGSSENKTVEVIECKPRIDEAQERVFMQTKTVHKTNGRVTNSGQCVDSLKFFALRRDYNADGCSDYVNHLDKKAYDRYRKYWVDGKGERHYFGDRIYVDSEKPHPFINEKGNCPAFLDLDAMTAHPQVETVYFGQGNTRVIVKTCHKDPSLDPVAIRQTNQGCEPLHNIEENYSIERKRGIYNIDDIEHQAFVCRVSGDRIPHEFDDRLPCKPVKNLLSREYQPTGKRFIKLSDGKICPIGLVCEPFGEKTSFDFLREDCKRYTHDFNLGKSYAFGKWVYQYRGKKKIMSACTVGPLSYKHQTEIVGYDHDDSLKVSHGKHKIWINTQLGPLVLKESAIIESIAPIPYQFKEERIAKSLLREPYYDGCFEFFPQDKYKVFERVDNSEYIDFLSRSADKKSANLCQVLQKTRVVKPRLKTEQKYVKTLNFQHSIFGRFYAPHRESYSYKEVKGWVKTIFGDGGYTHGQQNIYENIVSLEDDVESDTFQIESLKDEFNPDLYDLIFDEIIEGPEIREVSLGGRSIKIEREWWKKKLFFRAKK